MAFNPTKAQENAINVSSGALVCAAAGSGKTAVLAERVAKLLTGESRIEADRILVVTFMSAAAEEMRQRIESKLNALFLENPQNRFLYSQKLKLRSAKICTIDSFCIELVRENFDVFGIAPDFKVGDENTVSKISDRVLGDILNREFEANSPEFLSLLNALCSKFDETDLKDAIIGLYRFSQNLPFPNDWFGTLINSLETDEYKAKIISEAMNMVKASLRKAISKIDLAILGLEDNEELFSILQPILLSDKENYKKLLAYADDFNWNEVYITLNTLSFLRWPTIRNSECSALTAARVLRDEAKEEISWLKSFVDNDEITVINEMSDSLALVKKLAKLTLEYSKLFLKECLKENTLTFSQAEHFALDLLCKKEEGEIILTDLANDIISRFDEVLVDEFQDINDMQDLLFNILSNNQKNLFAVGDVKQSIYGFRGSNPDNFLNKKNSYSQFESLLSEKLQKIILGNNFRSRKGVCDFVNYLFNMIMNGEKSDIEYDEEEILIPTAKFPENKELEAEVHFIDLENNENSADELEAQYIADYINNYLSNGMVTREKNNEKILVAPEFSDFALILRGVKSKGNIYADTLRKNGIPVKFSAQTAFNSSEIKIILSLLTVVSNPTRDIELASVMMSPLFAFSADEMAGIRAHSKKTSLISAVTAAANSGNVKAEDFLKKLNDYRTAAVSLGVGDLIDYLYEVTNIVNIVSALPDGKTRSDNLMLLYAKALEYQELYSSKNILKFVDFIRSLNESEGAAISKENAVTITTIHKSKGLQYPVCIIADTSKHFSGEDRRSSLLNDVNFGVGFKYFDNLSNEKKETLQFKVIKEKNLENTYREEMRLLYVAMTRAQEKIVVVNSAKKLDDKISSAAAISSVCQNTSDYIKIMADSKSYFDWILKASVVHPNFKLAEAESRFIINTVSNIDFIKHSADKIILSSKINEENSIGTADSELVEQIKNNLNYVYPFVEVKEIETKSSVAVIAHKADANDYSFTAMPDFMSAAGLSPAKRGTATHRFMQFCDFNKAEKSVEAELERLYEWEYISEAERDAVDVSMVEKFFNSDIYGRIKNSSLVKREMRFITEMAAGRFNSELSKSVADEPVIIQGSVDLVFVEDEKLVVLDFKTDQITDEEKLKEAYAQQLNIYATACEKIFEKPIKESLLYSFKLGKTVQI